jgi:hypothetical protein
MNTITRTLLITSSAALLALTGTLGAVGAAQKGHQAGASKQHIGAQKHAGAQKQRVGVVRSTGKAHSRYARNNRGHRNYRIVDTALRGVYIAGASSGCSYSYRKWQATGSAYWRTRYYDCRNG